MSDDIDDLKKKLKEHEGKIRDQGGGHRNLLWILLIGASLGAAYFLGYWPVVEKYALKLKTMFSETYEQTKTTIEQNKDLLKKK